MKRIFVVLLLLMVLVSGCSNISEKISEEKDNAPNVSIMGKAVVDENIVINNPEGDTNER
jgi:uncharacterized protein YceK